MAHPPPWNHALLWVRALLEERRGPLMETLFLEEDASREAQEALDFLDAQEAALSLDPSTLPLPPWALASTLEELLPQAPEELQESLSVLVKALRTLAVPF